MGILLYLQLYLAAKLAKTKGSPTAGRMRMFGNQEKVALFGNIHQTNKGKYARGVVDLLLSMGYGVEVERRFFECAGESLAPRAGEIGVFGGGDDLPDASFAVSLGGDGTFLRTAMLVGGRGVPILGVNTGHLGFMSEVRPRALRRALDDIAAGRCRIESRSVLEAAPGAGGGGSLGVWPFALNEVAVLKQDVSSMIKVRVAVNGEYLTTYSADGLIIATPTGSTGYALSAGGPVVVPDSRSMVVAPVAPHSLGVRPIVLCDNVEVSLRVESRTGHYLVSVDGRSAGRSAGGEIVVRRAPYDIKTIHCGSKTFFDTLREKLMWDGDLQK